VASVKPSRTTAVGVELDDGVIGVRVERLATVVTAESL